jgi:hypothetical protein
MKKYVEEQVTTTELTDWVGVEFDLENVGIVAYIGDAYHIICSDTCRDVHSDDDQRHNIACGGRRRDGISIKDTIDEWKNSNSSRHIREVYCFDTYKQLMTWFAGHIKE